MKSLRIVLGVFLTLAVSACAGYDDTQIKKDIADLQQRMTALETHVNSNISSLTQIITALQDQDYIVSYAPYLEDLVQVGYQMNFAKSGSIIIYFGKDGKDGEDGKDGVDGHTPQIGVRQDTDGLWYWTLDGEWLKDAAGQKIKAVGEDGKDGEDGDDGDDGITPQLKIEADYWYVSTDNGKTWTKLGKAKGEDGKDGADGDSLFTEIDTSSEDYVVFTLSDGTTIKVPTWASFARLNQLCTQMNSNLEGLSEILEALEDAKYIKSFAPIIENNKEIGYALTLSDNTTIKLYHGKDGATGQGGGSGQTPLIGVRQDTDDIWYWTLDGEWLLDEQGNKVKAVGTDGQDGAQGPEGPQGPQGGTGLSGKDGITPQLKIENDYWYVSVDGESWTKLGKATGEDGADGDSFFKTVTEDDGYVYFTLTDDTVLTLPKSSVLEVTFDPAENISLPIGIPTDITYEVTSSLTPVKVQVVTSSDIRAKVTNTDANGLAGTITVVAQKEIDEYSQIIVLVDNGEKVFTQAFTTINGGLQGTCVDLGLPSGLKWATCNVGATQPEDYGDYFAWGETETYYEKGSAQSKTPEWKYGKAAGYLWDSYKFELGTDNYGPFSKYVISSSFGTVDNKTVLDPEDDVAHVKLGGAWRMPTDAEWGELIDNCTWVWTTQKGVNGRLVTGPNGNSIFLPASGNRNETYLNGVGSRGDYWSSSLNLNNPDRSWNVFFNNDDLSRSHFYRRCYGHAIRPVNDEGVRVAVASISLDHDALTLLEGAYASLVATVMPANATQPAVIWSSSNTDVATVDYTGMVTAVATGTAIITATTYDGGLIATCRVTVSSSGGGGDDTGDDPGEGLGGNQYYGSGVVTAGEWNDIEEWGFWSNLLDNQDWAMYAAYWHFYPRNFVCVEVVDADETPVSGVNVALIKDANTVWNAVSDNSGRAVLWAALYEDTVTVNPSGYTLEIAGKTYHNFEFTNLSSNEVKINKFAVSSNNVENAIDVAFIVDATGSMGDEIAFLKSDLKDIIQMVGQQCTAQVRTGTVFYRDEGDDYVTKYSQFTADVNETSQFIGKQQAEGGGDWPEAVHTALNVGVQSLGWNANAKGRVAFLFLDAPPHHEDDIIADCQNAIASYAQRGIKVIPVAGSGIDKGVEYLLRSFAMATDGTYVFITNGVGNEYIEATIGEYQVEKLRDIIARLIVAYAQ